ncbi:hypothetical protein [Kitasatospora cineracea]|uniref:hypothetical protein n=1 Tax=Kitasatospora cineracea TaxID=88074 RepID=UPI0036CB04AD
MATDPTKLTTAELDERERRLNADAEDAKKALWKARSRYDAICDELRDIRIQRREMENGR